MRTGTIIGLSVTALVGVLAIAGVLVARAYAQRPVVDAVSPAPGAVVNGEMPVRIVLRSPDEATAVRVAIDGEDASAGVRRTDAGAEVDLPDLPDGEHTVDVAVDSTGLVGGTATYRWRFRTDATPPPVQLTPTQGWTDTARIDGISEPGATITAAWSGGRASTGTDDNGSFTLVPAVEEGRTAIQLTATDQAGNTTQVLRAVQVDATRPKVRLSGGEDWITDTDRPTVYAFVDDASPTRIRATVNGQEARAKPMAIGFIIETGRLPQGTSTLNLEVTDATGRTTTRSREVRVDSTDVLRNNLTLAPGARGRDVARLTRRLKVEKLWTGPPSWKYDDKVEAAVRAYQRKAGLPEDGVARPALLMRTAGRIVVLKSKFVLNLWLDGKLAKQYPVAVGQSAYPTPTGSYVVTEKVANPTWIPPNSPWAAGLEAVPPGTTNPLGTRWIGTSAPLIGIHGTPQDWTIGSAASHGCIRMHISDVEDLYDRVTVGMPVEIKD